MSAASGITASQGLIDEYAAAVDSGKVRFLKASIRDESLVSDGSWPPSGKLSDDLTKLATILKDNEPAYILAKLDGVSEWLFISYVPDTAKVKDKMLYAATRNALTKALGGDRITDTIFATSKADVTPEGYSAHLRHLAAPKPMTARELEIEATKAAERLSSQTFEGSQARKSHHSKVGLKWTPEVEKAVKDLGSGTSENFLILGINLETETLKVVGTANVKPETLAAALPKDEPSYSIYMWQPKKPVFVYACPSASKVKSRMIYSSGSTAVVQQAQGHLGTEIAKRLETSDPEDLDLTYFSQTSSETNSGTSTPNSGRAPRFAKPQGPYRRGRGM